MNRHSAITERQRVIANAVVVEHIRSAEPVGSRAVCEGYGLDCSPATVRNEMVCLEREGYLEQPHTSAGRVPLEPAYRLHVNGLQQARVRLDSQTTWMAGEMRRLDAEPELALRRTSDLLSQMTRYPAVVTHAAGPESESPRLTDLSLSPVSAQNVLFSFALEEGSTQQALIETDKPVKVKDVEALEQVLRRVLLGRPPNAELRPDEAPDVDEGLLSGIRTALEEAGAGQVYVEGGAFMLDQPEFEQIDRLRRVMETLSRSPVLLRLLRTTVRAGAAAPVSVTIGSEHGVEPLRDCSVVAANYRTSRHGVGTVGVVGPMRMDYRLAMTAVACVARELGQTLDAR